MNIIRETLFDNQLKIIAPLGVSFDTSLADLISQIPVALRVFAEGVESFLETSPDGESRLVPHLSCDGTGSATTASKWTVGREFHQHLQNVTLKNGFGKPDLEFLPDGTLKSVELKIMNLRPGLVDNLVWEEVRTAFTEMLQI